MTTPIANNSAISRPFDDHPTFRPTVPLVARSATSRWSKVNAHRHLRYMRTLMNTLRLAYSVYQERQALAKLDSDRLRDIGIHPVDARHEIKRAPWDLPRDRRS